MHTGDGKLDVNYTCDREYRRADKYDTIYTPLKKAIELDDEFLVSNLIQAGANTNACYLTQRTGDIYHTPLIDAVMQGNLNICRILLENGATVNTTANTSNTHSVTALTIALQCNRSYAIVELLLSHGACHTFDKCGRSFPLHMALAFNQAMFVDLFMQYGYKWRKYSCSIHPFVFGDELCDAIAAGAEDCCVTLLQWGFNVRSNDYPYFHQAIERGMTRLTRMLIQVKPQYLQEGWIVFNDATREDITADVLDKLLQERRESKTLQELCKASILQELTSGTLPYTISEQINQLALPTRIKQFLNYWD